MGLCVSSPRTYLTRDSAGHLVEVTERKPTRAEKKADRQQAKAMQDQFRAMGLKNVKVNIRHG